MEYYDLGTHSWPVTTSAPEAQAGVDRGLIWAYGFNHEEAVYCFEQALSADPDCAMAYWGVAYALGPNYNKPWEAFDEEDRNTNLKRTHVAAGQAKVHSATALPVERALIAAIQSRYPQEWPTTDFSVW